MKDKNINIVPVLLNNEYVGSAFFIIVYGNTYLISSGHTFYDKINKPILSDSESDFTILYKNESIAINEKAKFYSLTLSVKTLLIWLFSKLKI